MRRRICIFLFITLIVASSCQYPGTPATETVPATPTGDSANASIALPSVTPTSTLVQEFQLPTPTPTSTPSVALASPRGQPVNCRVGPDISYAVIGALNLGSQAEVIGKNIDITWIYVRNPSDPSNNCWLSVDFIDVDGNVELLPVVGPPEIMVTNIQVQVEPVAMNVACDDFPQNVVVNAQITTNGPTIVTWFWESSTGKTSQEKQIVFDTGTSKIVQDYYQVDQAGDYLMQVKTNVPNSAAGNTTFKVTCTP